MVIARTSPAFLEKAAKAHGVLAAAGDRPGRQQIPAAHVAPSHSVLRKHLVHRPVPESTKRTQKTIFNQDFLLELAMLSFFFRH